MILLLFFFSALMASPQERRPIIAIGGIMHESDTFNPAKTELSDFVRRGTTPPAEALAEWARSNDEVSGYIEGAGRLGLELYPGLVAAADPKGPVTDEAFNTLVEELIRRLRSAPRLDGLLLANHGAMVVESYPHGDAEMVRRLRQVFGPAFPIVVAPIGGGRADGVNRARQSEDMCAHLLPAPTER